MINPKSLKNLTNGRRKGAKNKFTTLKDAFLGAFEKMGGMEELYQWGMQKRNRKDFYHMLAKMLPKTDAADQHTHITVINHIPRPAEEETVIGGNGKNRHLQTVTPAVPRPHE